jgi:cytidylate kinase
MNAEMPVTAAPDARGPVVALDGPGSSGKTSVGAAAAASLGLRFCDTGLLYRAVAWLALQRGIGEGDEGALAALAGSIRLEADPDGRLATVTVDGVDVTSDVGGPAVEAAVSGYARIPALRTALLVRQRQIAAAGGIVMAGRDIGTVVLPDADFKVYLDASVEERARRRAAERGLALDSPEALEVREQLRSRDAQDSSRAVAPLRAAPDAVVIRTDGRSFDETVDALVSLIASAAPAGVAAVPAAALAPVPAETRPVTTPAREPRRARGAQPVRHLAPIAPTPIATRITFVIRTADFIIRCLVRSLTRVRVEGDIRDIPRTGAVLIAANHASNADPLLVAGFLTEQLGRPPNWMGKRELFDWPLISWLARQGGVHPVERGAADVEAFRMAMRILEGGNILGVFPEGTRSPDGRLQEAKDGVTVLASRSGATVVPIGIANSDRLWSRGRFLPRFTPSVTITIGKPFTLDDEGGAVPGPAGPRGDTAARKQDAAQTATGAHRRAKVAGTDLIMRRIAALLPERQRGVYGEQPPA